MLFPTTLVGSYPQPDWLIDRGKLAGTFPPRVRARELWRVPAQFLAQAQDDATIVAIKAQEEAGVDIITDGEMRRESYSNHFATSLEGLDLENPAIVLSRSGRPNPVPRIVGELRRKAPICVDDLAFLKRHTQRKVKITLPGPFTMSAQAKNEFYASDAEAALAYARVLNGEISDLFAAGADVVQIDEPYMQASPELAEAYGLDALNAALGGIVGTTAVHICFGYAALVQQRPSGYSFLPQLTRCSCMQVSLESAQSGLDLSILSELEGKKIILGVIDLADMQVETPETVAARIRRALAFAAAEDIIVAPDCGMKYLPRDVAFAKLVAMVAGARIMRQEIGGAE
jgi:5-methyltetrahydropteroyltriglutamate--homocysteine methyltransferase